MKQEEYRRLLKQEQEKSDTLILAHTYQAPEILAVADVCGDSYALAKAATAYPQKRVVVCGVRFMAETVKILSPEKCVLLPKRRATCPMAEQISPARVRAFREENPDVTVVAYVNTTAALKAECDVCVTSSSAVRIVRALPGKKILFIPDQNLGAWVREQCPEKEIILWDGYCPVHGSITEQDVLRAKAQHPHAKLAMHPECPPQALAHADMIGATSEIIRYTLQNEEESILFGTECGVYNDLIQKYPNRQFYQLRGDKLVCPDMKMTSLEDVYAAVAGKGGEEIQLEEGLRLAARRSLDNMLKYGG
ncbi:MAG TPA: quinolinate synthase NadA [Candidatus Fimivicinus intestinavium]|nr:quinolinate synthase NadA [Candidatus Fimivicinus intestinavium]